MDTISWQRLEGACVCVSALVLFAFTGVGIAWWLTAVLFFAPDISFAGHLAGSKLGAVVYNLVYVYHFGVVLLAIGVGVDAPVVAALGALWIAHSGLTARSDTGSSRRRDSPSPILGPLAGRKK